MALDDFKNPFEVNDFSGGITDDVFFQDPTRAKEIDNLLIKSDKTLDDRPGSVIDDIDEPQIPAGVQRIGALIKYGSEKLFVQSARKLYYRDPSAYATLQGPTGNDVFSVGTTTNAISVARWNGHLYLASDAFARPMKIFRDSAGDYQVRTAGLPVLSAPTVTPGAGANTYIYSFHYEYTYTVDDRTFQDFGAVTQVTVENSDDPGTTPNSISAIPVLSNGASDNWETSVIRIFIYRTLAGGQDSYKIGQVTNGTTTFNDNFADTAIEDNERLYLDDGTLDFDPVPLSKYVHVVNNTGYAAHVKVGAEIFKNIVRQSVPADPDSYPEGFEIEVEDEITGMSSARSVPIILCKKKIYRIEDAFDQFGRGAANPVSISDAAGCVSNNSVVQVDIGSGSGGIFWFGNDGVYFSDGYQVLKVSDGNNERYKALLASIVDTKRIQGRFDEKERRVYWTVQKNSGSLENDCLLVLELRKGISPDMPFTTWSGASLRPTDIEFFDGQMYRADSRGFVFKHDAQYSTDPKVDTTENVEDWYRETIIWNYESINYNFGSTHLRKFVPKVLLTASNKNNTSIQMVATNDDGRLVRPLKMIRWRRNFVWGDEDFVWGSPDCVWNAIGIIEQWRRFPANGLRLSYLSLQITNAKSLIIGSDSIGTSTFDNVAKTVVLNNAPTQSWPTESVDYVIKTEVDNYQTEFVVTARTADTLTVLDSSNVLPLGSYKWELWGYKKGEPLNLLSYNIHWLSQSQTQMTFEAGQDGGNA